MRLLPSETKTFVELLFKTLETQEYTLPPAKSDPDGGGTPPGINPPAPVLSTEKIIETISLVPVITTPSVPIHINGSASATVNKREIRKSDSDKIDKEKEKHSRSRYNNFILCINIEK